MAKRYIPRSSFTVRNKKGLKQSFQPTRVGADGTLGYSEEEVANVYKEHLASFKVEDVDGDHVRDDEPVVETATAAPGEKRSTKKKK